MKIGSHQSSSGSIDKVFERALSDECECFQMFVKSPTRWSANEFNKKEIDAFLKHSETFGSENIVVHAAYLINLASANEETIEKSFVCLADELSRCTTINVPYYVMHPGSSGGTDTDDAIKKIAEGIDKIYNENNITTTLLLENTAGSGNQIGGDFSQLVQIIEQSKHQDKLGVCIDTCHAFGYGYDLINKYEDIAKTISSLFGDKLRAMHLNDSKKDFGSKLDRHEFLGVGNIGIELFKNIVTDSRLTKALGILETPVKDGDSYLKEVRMLKEFRGK